MHRLLTESQRLEFDAFCKILFVPPYLELIQAPEVAGKLFFQVLPIHITLQSTHFQFQQLLSRMLHRNQVLFAYR